MPISPRHRAVARSIAAIAATGTCLALAVPAQAGGRDHDHHGDRHDGPRIVVAQDGSGDAATIQEAVDLAPENSTERVEILIEPGVYQGRVDIDAAHPRLSFVGATGRAKDVVITDDRAAGTAKPEGGTWGTTGSATVTVSGAEFHATAVTFENAFDEAAHPELSGHQAVAVKTRADKIVFDDVRFLGNQDTLYLDTPSVDVPSRVYVRDSYVEGDVDFIFGRATAVIEDTTINALDRDSDPSGYVFAPSTSGPFSHGFLVVDSRFVTTAEDDSFFLGRPWHPSSSPNSNPRVVVRDSWLGAHIKDDPWTTMSGFDWVEGTNAEYRNSGPGAKRNADRPQLTRTQARDHEVGDYLAGSDGWAPQTERRHDGGRC